MQFVIGLLVGLLIGAVVLFAYRRASRRLYHPIGDLRVDRSDPVDAPLLFLELDPGTNVGTIMQSDYALFRVKLENFLPHD